MNISSNSEHIVIMNGVIAGISNEDIIKKINESREKRKELIKKAAKNIIIVIIISFLLYLLFK